MRDDLPEGSSHHLPDGARRTGRMVLITGGARSGKSTFAERLAMASGKEVIYVATCMPQDEEMQQRVEEHRRRRPPAWRTREEPFHPGRAMREEDSPGRCFILDCLTLFLSNHLCSALGVGIGPGDPCDAIENTRMTSAEAVEVVMREARQLAQTVRKLSADALVVTNEVGMGLVPEWPLGRLFRDLAGRVNQEFAGLADEVYAMFCGLPLRVK